MKTSELGIRVLKQLEGFRPALYDDVAGFPTIGYGHRPIAGEDFSGIILDDAEAEVLLRKDLELAEHAINALVQRSLKQGQFDALVSFTFNLGVGVLKSSTLLKVLNDGRCCAVPEQLRRFVNAGGKRILGLVNRREREIQLWVNNA